DNWTIINPKSGLVLAATSGEQGTTLTVETNIYAASQAWLPTNNSEPFITFIVGFNALCLQENSGNLWLQECATEKAEQAWVLYGDGTIRPQQNLDNCLTSDVVEGAVVNIMSCSGSSGQ
ncbi:ricin-agglutinin family protein, partial [Ricinus communis]